MKKKFLMFVTVFFLFLLCSCSFDRVDDTELVENGYSCIVNFNANGGTFGSGSTTVRHLYCKSGSYICEPGSKVYSVNDKNKQEASLSDYAVKQNYVLDGWYEVEEDQDGNPVTDSNGNLNYLTKFDFATTKITKSVTNLYAKWANYYTYTIYFGVSGSNSFIAGSRINSLNATDKVNKPVQDVKWEGHTFLGYYEDENFTTPFDWSVSRTYDENKNFNLFAKFVEGDFILVSKASDLKEIQQSKNYYLLNDIDMTGVVTKTPTTKFAGIIEGNGYTISNMTVNYTQSGRTDLNFGLFKKLDGASIKNLTIDNLQITLSVGIGTKIEIGILTSTIKASTIDNVTINNSAITVTYGGSLSESNLEYGENYLYEEKDSSSVVNINGTNNLIK